MPAAPAHQAELPLNHEDHHADPKDWIPVKLLCDEIEMELAESRAHLLRKLTGWLLGLRVFRRVESYRMYRAEPLAPRELEFHRALLTFLLGAGEMLLLNLRSHEDIDPNWVGLSFDDVKATVAELRSDLTMWHGDMTDGRRTQILSDVFGFED